MVREERRSGPGWLPGSDYDDERFDRAPSAAAGGGLLMEVARRYRLSRE
jgi:hypothetical protein